VNEEAHTAHVWELTLDEIVRELDAPSRELPERALRAAQRRRAEITPRLIQALQDATARAASGQEVQGNLYFFALFLLAEFGAKEALPAILEAISLPGELPFNLFDDAITENLPAILAALACDTPEWIEALVENRALNEYVRAAAADTYLYLVRDGRLSREDAVERLRRHLRRAIDDRDTPIADFLVAALDPFVPIAALHEIREAFALDLIDERLIDLEQIEEAITEGEPHFQSALESCRPTGIPDTVAEIKKWASYAPVDEPAEALSFDEDDAADWSPLDEDEDDDWSQPIRNTRRRVGRNDPCPCGSGKKFKKCCGRR
jgi:hypothetical protein